MNRISRRNFLKAAGVGAAALGLAACGGSSSSTASSVASSTAASSAAAAADVTIKVAAIETGYGADMWKKVAEAFTAQTGIKVDLTTDKKLEDVIGPSMQGGDYPDVVHLATGREAALTEQFIKGNLIADITDVLSMTVPLVVSSSMPPMKPSLPDSVMRPASAPAIQPICWAFGKSEETFLLTAFSGVSAAPFRRANAMSGYSSAACRTASVYWLPGA